MARKSRSVSPVGFTAIMAACMRSMACAISRSQGTSEVIEKIDELQEQGKFLAGSGVEMARVGYTAFVKEGRIQARPALGGCAEGHDRAVGDPPPAAQAAYSLCKKSY